LTVPTDAAHHVGIFGGSFNPPHVAHVLAAAYAVMVAPLDRVLVIPVYRHPFSKELAPFDDRMRMCELAFAPVPAASVSDVERELGGESLTLRTLEHLREQHPGWRMRLILGSDVVPDLPKWHRFDRIAEIAEPLILERRGATARPERSVLPELSSGMVRQLFASQDADGLAELLPRGVLDYARARGLYGWTSGA
jgi:nicotinate-nucleotide adenylyltransferase